MMAMIPQTPRVVLGCTLSLAAVIVAFFPAIPTGATSTVGRVSQEASLVVIQEEDKLVLRDLGSSRSLSASLEGLDLCDPSNSPALPGGARAQGSPYGPFGGFIWSVDESPSGDFLLASTFLGGVFRSFDGGSTWEPSWAGVTDIDVRSVAIDPTNPDIAYCGTFWRGVFRTTNRGTTWEPRNNGLGSGGLFGTVHLLSVDPRNGDAYSCPLGWGLRRTTNGGASWEPVGDGSVLPTLLNVLAFHPHSPDTMLAGGMDTGVYRTFDRGLTWTALNDDFIGFQPRVQTLAFVPPDPNIVYVTFFSLVTGDQGGIYRTTDMGDHWTPANNGIPRYINFARYSISPDPSDPDVAYVSTLAHSLSGVYKTTDSGASWVARNTGIVNRDVYPIYASRVVPGKLIIGSTFDRGGILISYDGAATWTFHNHGLTGHYVTDMVRAGDALFATARGAIFRLGPQDTEFSYVVQGLPPVNSENTIYATIAANPLDPDELIAGNTLLVRDGIFKTTNSGGMWQVVGAGSPGFNATKPDLVYDPMSPSTIYAATFGSGMFRSMDGGSHFTQINLGLNHLIVPVIGVDPFAPQILYIGTQRGGIYKSTDWGGHWMSRNTGIGDAAPEILDIALDPVRPNVIYAANLQNLPTSLYKSVDGAATWQSIVNNLASDAQRISLDPSDTEIVYVVGSDYHVYRSLDGGGSWGLLRDDQYYTGFYPDPSAAGIYWGTTIGSGIFRIDDAATVEADGSAGRSGVTLTVPGPCLGSVAIEYKSPSPEPSWATLDIIDVRGRLIRRLLDEERPGGRYTVWWDGKSTSGERVVPGVYLCRLSWQGEIMARKLVLADR